MVSWVWLIVSLIGGAAIGSLLMGLCCANDTGNNKKWWEE